MIIPRPPKPPAILFLCGLGLLEPIHLAITKSDIPKLKKQNPYQPVILINSIHMYYL